MTAALSLAFVMDPIDRVSIDEDTTFALMLEAQRRGHEVLYIDPADLGVEDGRPTAIATPVRLQRKPGDHVEKGEAERIVLDERADVVMQRTDPPVDAAYTTATQILGLCRRALVLNRPCAILTHNEKLFAQQFRELMPRTLVSRNRDELVAFMDSLGGEMVVKPLDGKGGEGIFYLHTGDRNVFSLLEQSTGFGSRPAMAQEYLPAIREGDKRILLLEGEPLGALLRVPADQELRANLHVGGRAVRSSIDDADRRIIDAVAPVLRKEGLFLVGIDVIGGRLTEINVTSPTGLQEVGRLDGLPLEDKVLERLEALVVG